MSSITIYVEGLAYDLFDRDCVTEHNKLRRLHGSQSLSWSESLAVDAQKWAEYLAINDKIEHDGDTLAEKDEGENIAWFVPPQPKCQGSLKPNCFTCSEVVQNWYDESGNYNYQMGIAKKPDLPIKHFAQVVWNASMEIGVGSAISKTYGFISVARYSPKGGEGGPQAFIKNVFPKGAVPILQERDSTSPSSTPKPTILGGTENAAFQNESSLFDTDEELTNQELEQKPMEDITCGIVKRRGPTGNEAIKPGEFPWQVGFRYQNRLGKSNVFCRGSLLDREWILTAAHCFVVRVNPKFKLKVLLGEFDAQNEDGREVVAEASKVIRHPLHRKNTKDYNIALVKLKTPLKEFNDYMRPICLPDQTVSFSGGEICTVTGSGLDYSLENAENTLRAIDVPILSPVECRTSVRWLTDRMLCSGYTERVLDTCKGDSGGPLACYNKGKFYLGGIVSHEVIGYDDFGKTCVVSHNGLRKIHGAQPVAWSEELAKEATEWCEKLAMQGDLGNDNTTMDSKNRGENIAATSLTNSKSGGPRPELCAMAVDEWYSEIVNYNFETGLPKSPGLPIKHFAQVMTDNFP
ncbi:hypothetical protein pdam_00009103 [Pocillopora damicornis]|uniref:Peptidase S1 domain-containing protein n=1 Tax=Pocillopora damicornis TaxID=46731 RepID=A0A3M6V2Y5_POCDA|nr:hypothetical protein pdam_00009103 [Pocillopora damicornis]